MARKPVGHAAQLVFVTRCKSLRAVKTFSHSTEPIVTKFLLQVFLRHLKQPLLGWVQQAIEGASSSLYPMPVISTSRTNEASQGGFAGHNASVISHVSRRWYRVNQFGEIGRTAQTLSIPPRPPACLTRLTDREAGAIHINLGWRYR